MLAILLKILSVLGIILLVLLGIMLFLLLLVLFFPIVYRIYVEKNEQVILVNGRVGWLFGLIRAKIKYPEPGNIVVKCLWFTLYDSGKNIPPQNASNTKQNSSTEVPESTAQESSVEPTQELDADTHNVEEDTKTSDSEYVEQPPKTFKEKLYAKYEKIKYTIKKIYDKIKHILENISFYKELLQDSETQGLLSHGWNRLRKIFRSIRPRKLKAEVIFGADSPDTTGYVYGIYGMLMPKIGKQVTVTPDFTQQILEGQINAAGHITVFTILRHVLAVVFDKRLQRLKQKLDAHKRKMQPKT